jgi:hypothetical protein
MLKYQERLIDMMCLAAAGIYPGVGDAYSLFNVRF